ncbi:AGE family epimerase/isomerase [Saccharothrix deserti]|uniref:AGE family epimerase/isomerase n=1 Tax=Saccharothrix deserti TaxID=2593674 RepID=UPI00131E0446|nr:AGE family epimerase/isomerase [Saccharothrix deserti]
MTTAPERTYSDLYGGYVVESSGDRLVLATFGGDREVVHRTSETSAQLVRNLGEPYQDVNGRLDELLTPGAMVFSFGPVYPGPRRQQAERMWLVADGAGGPVFDRPDWWVDQIRSLAKFYRRAQFGSGPVDFADYRTVLRLGGDKTDSHVQETDTISRLVYGMATSYMLTGDEAHLEVAERGSEYLRDNLRFVDETDVGRIVYWYHGLEVDGGRLRKLFASEFSDDELTIPAYEQIYALSGLVQTYRLTGTPWLRDDIEATIRLFERHYADPRTGGYFSHVDPLTLSPHAESLGRNRSRKNWNSVGDHAPAYLFNLYLATGEQRYLRMLEHTFDMIVTHFPDRGPDASPFVRERFHADWTPDKTWGWQQDRAVVGHNLKIAWNLTRMNALRPKNEYTRTAARLAATMPGVGRDPRRGGWYDVLERQARDGRHAFVWHDRKAWWQQEQAILAYLVLAGSTGDAEYLKHAAEAEAFYNAFFLDHDDGGVYFSVQAAGAPYLAGLERLKGNHSMSMYHSAELCYLATVYNRLLWHGEPLDLWFSPDPDAAFPGGLLRVAPDALPRGRVVLDQVLVDGSPYRDFDAEKMTVKLPEGTTRRTVQVRLRPVAEDER